VRRRGRDRSAVGAGVASGSIIAQIAEKSLPPPPCADQIEPSGASTTPPPTVSD
jgi:hypothetical protein